MTQTRHNRPVHCALWLVAAVTLFGCNGTETENGAVGGSVATLGGSPATGTTGVSPSGGTVGQGGAIVTVVGSTVALSGGSSSVGGGVATTGGAVSTGDTTAKGGSSAVAAGGTTAKGGSSAAGGTTAVSTTTNPFGCGFAWGAPYGSSNDTYLDFVSQWIGGETNAGLASWSSSASVTNEGSGTTCWACGMITTTASSSAIPTFYAYVIGYQACLKGGFCDCNTDTDGSTLCTGGAQWIRDNRATVINAYAQYAKVVAAKSPSKASIWLLEGDFVQYTNSTQSSPLTYAEEGALMRDITNAIKANAPMAIVAVNHSPWLTDAITTSFWSAMPLDVIDWVWMQGYGDTDVFPNSGAYNAATANYAWLHAKTGKYILAETSYQSNTSGDRWTTATADNINARIANGVIGVLVSKPPWTNAATFASATSAFSALKTTCN